MSRFDSAVREITNSDFGTPFIINPDGTFRIDDNSYGEYSVNYTGNDGNGNDYLELDDNWVAVSGMSGQHDYSGPVMHTSETLTSGIIDSIVSDKPVRICLSLVTDMSDDPDFPEDSADTIGWIILRGKD